MTLLEILETWQEKQVQRRSLMLQIQAIDNIINGQSNAAKVLIREGATTGDRARDIAIGVHGTLEPMVVLFYRQIEGEMARCVDQLVLVVERVSNDDRMVYSFHETDGDDETHGLMPTSRPRPHRRLSVGRLSGKELIFDRKKMTVSFPTNGEMITCVTDWECIIFTNHNRPKIELANLPLKVYTEDALASSDGKPMPGGMSVLLGDKAIKQWFEKNASLGTLQRLDNTPTLWDKMLACFNPASAASIDSGL